MKIEIRDRETGWLLAEYEAASVAQARERLRQTLRREEARRDKFLQKQAALRDKVGDMAARCETALAGTVTADQREAIRQLQAIVQNPVEWDSHGLEFRSRRR